MLAGSFRPRVIATLATLAIAACSSTTAGGSPQRSALGRPVALTPRTRVFDAERITRTGAVTGWDAVRILIPEYRLDAARTPSLRSLGASGLPERGAPVRLILDGHQMDMEALRAISAQEILSIQLVNGPEAAIHFGGWSGAGAIVVQTRLSLRPLGTR